MLKALPRLDPNIQAVFFDAVGTLIHPEPSAGTAYFAIGQQYGSRLDVNLVRQRFAQSFAHQEEIDQQLGLRTDEQREEQRWRAIVAEVLPDLEDPEGCFRALYDYFAHPSAWRCDPDAGPVLQELMQRGYRVGLASNFDHRLRTVVSGLPELAGVQHQVISSEVGWRKPARGFFEAVCARVDLAPEQILLVGDDLANDHFGASSAGLKALLLDPAGCWTGPAHERIRRLAELLSEDGRAG